MLGVTFVVQYVYLKCTKQFKETTTGVKINGKLIHSIRFADDIALVAESEQDLSNMLTNVSIALERVQLKINAKKTKNSNSRKTWKRNAENH